MKFKTEKKESLFTVPLHGSVGSTLLLRVRLKSHTAEPNLGQTQTPSPNWAMACPVPRRFKNVQHWVPSAAPHHRPASLPIGSNVSPNRLCHVLYETHPGSIFCIDSTRCMAHPSCTVVWSSREWWHGNASSDAKL